jgi:hypothetical protein
MYVYYAHLTLKNIFVCRKNTTQYFNNASFGISVVRENSGGLAY